MPVSKLIIISHPKVLMGEMDTIYELFDLGLDHFHIRKENFTEEDYRNYLNKFPKIHRHKLVLHEYPALAEKYKLKGCHFKSEQTPEGSSDLIKGLSTHTLQEIETKQADYYYLSPVYESTSKPGYTSNVLNELEAGKKLPSGKKIMALGGIKPDNMASLNRKGFTGVAVLGYIWNEIHTFKIKENFLRLKEETEKHF